MIQRIGSFLAASFFEDSFLDSFTGATSFSFGSSSSGASLATLLALLFEVFFSFWHEYPSFILISVFPSLDIDWSPDPD